MNAAPPALELNDAARTRALLDAVRFEAAVATKKQLISKALTTSVYRKPAEPTGEEDNECCICLDEFEDEERIKKLRCGHLFLNCIKKWPRGHARPTCRQP
ncbi:ubiquitin-protein transferase [Aureococcus anophagefferens]|nr:ubiquitin-protein transferase [Aureococcus anophagefferens]